MKNEFWMNPPTGCVDAVLDTDTYNEIDDQFALSYMLRAPERIRLRAIYAAPFYNSNSSSPEDGMEKSYQEIFHLLSLLGMRERAGDTYRGSRSYLPDEQTPVESEAARHLVALSREYTSDHPLYVVAIGAITNVASAFLMDPTLRERVVVVWLGGHAHHWRDTAEFNMVQDVAAARVVFASGVPLVQFPCMGVVSAFTVSGDDMKARLLGKNELCTYLTEHSEEAVRTYTSDPAWSRVIWDVCAAAWLTQTPDARFFDWEVIPRFLPGYDNRYDTQTPGAPMVYVTSVRRDELWRDMIRRLAN